MNNLKELVKKHLDAKKIAYKDVGCDSKTSCDYPEYGKEVAKSTRALEYPQRLFYGDTRQG